DGRVRVEGARIERVEGFAFDSPADGVLEQDEHELRLRSRTTGDVDGLDLWLDQAGRGRLVFESEIGRLEVELAALDGRGVTHSFGGLDLHARVHRYPEAPIARMLTLSREVEASGGQPLLVKAVQTDGHMAWASPVYVD